MAKKTTSVKLADTVKEAKDAVTPIAEQTLATVQETVLPALAEATEQTIAAVQHNVLPALADAKDKLAPVAEDAKAAIAPMAATAVATTKHKAADAAALLSGEPEEKKKKHRVRNLLIVLGIAGAAAFAYRKLTGGSEPTWVSPDPEVGPDTTSSGAEDKSDTAPTAPLPSEETVESPTPTTPDEPLEEHQV